MFRGGVRPGGLSELPHARVKTIVIWVGNIARSND